ncbi:hypothetical protein HUJ04_002214 [Dendroctonus ponderosae]|nr:hypothetical protein HUJ04_002214 [Dendroctonus ponderosae]KAH1017973.1 hypothetical protein HUJ05_008543 [Dendroctonus ponderosae]KAH1017974.1 hypothetical protein HUJ05_008543 [Dendroctonus ponderosae]
MCDNIVRASADTSSMITRSNCELDEISFLERTALHYAMGVEKMETISRLLIKGGAKRVVKDLKGRQPTYYFLNKSDILRLQEEEETF